MLSIDELWQQNKALWNDCFHDDKAFVDLYFSQVAKPENTYYIEREGRLACVMQALPYELALGSVNWRAAYLSGIATLPEFRCQGLATSLIRKVHDSLIERGFVVSLLIPASESLADFYTKQAGYTLLTRVRDVNVVCTDNEVAAGFSLRAVDTQEALAEAYRQSNLSDILSVRHSSAQLNVVWEVWRQAEGNVWALYNDADGAYEGLAFCGRTSDGSVRVSDCVAQNRDKQQQLLLCLSRLYHPARLIFKEQLPAQTGKGRPYAMIKVLQPDLISLNMLQLSNLRMNLMMDE